MTLNDAMVALAGLGSALAAVFLFPAFLRGFRRTKLSFVLEDDPIRPVSLHEKLNDSRPVESYARLWVRNSGGKKADNVRVFARAKSSSTGCTVPSTVKRRLIWEGNQPALTLGPNGGDEQVIVAFSTDIELIGHGRTCSQKGTDGPLKLVAFLGTRSSWKNNRPPETDGFCEGTFDLEISAQAYDGRILTEMFTLKVAWNAEVHRHVVSLSR